LIQNWIKTFILLIFLSILFVFAGYIIAGTTGMYTALIFSIIMNILMFFYADKFVLKAYRAQPLDKTQYHAIYAIVEELAQKINISMPRIWYINTQIANAFAVGSSPHRSSIALTSGIVQLLNENELRGVLAHEISHIQNRDTLINTIAATFSGALGYLAQSFRYAFLFTTRRRREGEKNQKGPQLFVVIVIPLIAVLVQLAISRTREYLADESAAYITKDPLALASALEKMGKFKQHVYPSKSNFIYATTSSLFFLFPFPKNGLTMLKTHPPITQRIERLKKIYEQMISLKK